MKLFDIIDQEQAELLIDQHARYAFRGLSIVKSKNGEWYIYNGPWEVHFHYDNSREPIGYDTLAEALNECSFANLEKWGLL